MGIRFAILIYGFLLSLQAQAVWQFDERISVSGDARQGVFHHLEGAGRKHIAVSENMIAVSWEDDHSADPQVYVSLKYAQNKRFEKPLQVSTGDEAYEPAIAALSNDRFVLVWEQDGSVYANVLSTRGLNKPLKLSAEASASHASVTTFNEDIYVAWREQHGGEWVLKVVRLGVGEQDNLSQVSQRAVEEEMIMAPVLFPTLCANETGLTIAWEDRRDGHTRLKYSFSADRGQSFNEPQPLNEFYSNRNEYDKGNGVTRVSIASVGEDEMVAAWMDKRRGGAGYGIFASMGSDDSFGPNEKVHGEDGDKLPHYNPATAGNDAGRFVIAWDDYRSGSSDIWLNSYNEDGEWDKDVAPATAAGDQEQSHPSVAVDEQGGLHLVWIERADALAPTRLWYSYGKPAE